MTLARAMTSPVTFALGLLVLCQLCAAQAGDESYELPTIAVDAAWAVSIRQYKFLILLSRERIIQFINKRYQGSVLVKRIVLAPKSFQAQIQAVYCSFNSITKHYYYSKDKGYFNDRVTKFRRRLNYGKKRTFLQGGGPDAAARRGGHVVFFKGCYMADQYKWNQWGESRDVRPLGLPCHIDAAWKEDDTVMALKGDQIWRWELDDSVTGPRPFHDIYDSKGYFLLAPSVKPDDE